MAFFCPNCGANDMEMGVPCKHCGFADFDKLNFNQPQVKAEVPAEAKAEETQAEIPAVVEVNDKIEVCEAPVDTQVQKPEPKSKKPKKAKKPKKKMTFKRFLIKFGIFLLVNGLLVLLWCAFINQITLTIHSNDVVETINSGSLEIAGLKNEAYEELPIYLQEAMDNPNEGANGPVIDAMLPYVEIKTANVKGFFFGTEVEYTITAPDLESWLLNLDATDINSSEDLLAAMEEYIETAPTKSRNVTIEYYPDGWFQWKGNYKTPEFLDAIGGGISSAYTVLYQEFLNDLEAMMQ